MEIGEQSQPLQVLLRKIREEKVLAVANYKVLSRETRKTAITQVAASLEII